ncbi:hypothetical protein PPTG_20284 [Phytophthora nicotianae INRA-310]|uniref:Uncharacterized protein n=1 Tax=Phytophthora nicotianae (strain INRA-310) TaxID=761204 RepID=W2P9X3_PHYN3|nr:hypothetical protein PPTG_20284 [Phytophthora nicotianae INRA-310]ETM97465.1 hypothetical protein PPTG_20284 [Phytophthora nicotianae INRA-310]
MLDNLSCAWPVSARRSTVSFLLNRCERELEVLTRLLGFLDLCDADKGTHGWRCALPWLDHAEKPPRGHAGKPAGDPDPVLIPDLKLGGMCGDRGVGNPQVTLIVVTQDAEATRLVLNHGLETNYFCLSSLLGSS